MNTKQKHIFTSVAAAALVLASASSYAETKSNTLVNVASVVPACDITAIGIDFGVLSSPTTAKTLVATANSNTNTATHHKRIGSDGTGGGQASDWSNSTNNDELSINSGLPAPLDATVDGLLSTVVSNVAGVLPGVYVVCTVPITKVEIASYSASTTFAGTATDISAFATATPTATPTYKLCADTATAKTDALSTLTCTGTGKTIDYTMTITKVALPAAVNTALSSLSALGINANAQIYNATGNIAAGQTPDTGQFTDVVRATVTF